jgi:glutathione S-transferase
MIDFYELAGADQAVRFSPYCWRVRMALAHKGVEARALPWHFGDRKLPGGSSQVPVLVDDDKIIAGSTEIAFHLEHKYLNGPSLFGGEGGEAHVAFVIAWADTVLMPALLPIVAPDVIAQVKPTMQQAFREPREARMGMSFEDARAQRPALIEAARAAMAPLRHVVQERGFLTGSEPSYADYAVFGGFQWARCICKAELLDEADPIGVWRDSMLDLFGDLARTAKMAA